MIHVHGEVGSDQDRAVTRARRPRAASKHQHRTHGRHSATTPPALSALPLYTHSTMADAPAGARWRERGPLRFYKPQNTPPLPISAPLSDDDTAGVQGTTAATTLQAREGAILGPRSRPADGLSDGTTPWGLPLHYQGAHLPFTPVMSATHASAVEGAPCPSRLT